MSWKATVLVALCGALGCDDDGKSMDAPSPRTMVATVTPAGGQEARFQSTGAAQILTREPQAGEQVTAELKFFTDDDAYKMTMSWQLDEFGLPTQDSLEGDDALSFTLQGTRYSAERATVSFSVPDERVVGTFQAVVPQLGNVEGTFEAPLGVSCYRRSTEEDDGVIDGTDDRGWTYDGKNTSAFCADVVAKVL